ncbi:uncharacterized protein ACHE_30135S [Aspergillus chevalieri]|uniref:DUF7603 domain-containing protein n=1 Tax=Aspergillus chevalieri TaxID=182096 RepID=A0A7R7ZL72_ASPCH|nr:uncharacterized protein ACHE_30135S [Aspergillus chevalieri]BCR86148.1 hypothetical protein ACHE_30135S [Aspergillus chevalieri]
MIPPDGPVRPSSPVVSLQTITPSSPSPPTSSPSSHYSPHRTTVSRKPLPDNAATPAASSFPSVSHPPSAPLTPSSAPPAAPPPPPPPPGETPREYPQLQPPIAFAEDPSLALPSPSSLASSASSLVDEDSLLVPRDLDRLPHRGPSADNTSSAPATEHDVDYGSQFSNGIQFHSRLVSEPFIPVLPSPPAGHHRDQPAMALHPPENSRPPPLRIDSAGARSSSANSFDSKQQPKTPGRKISSFFGWKGPTSPGAESSSTEISDAGRSPLASPMPPSLPSASFSITPSTTVPLDNSKPVRNGSLSSATILDTKVNELENELREISSELAGSIRREMELEDLVERLQSEMPLDTTNRRTSDYFSDSGTSSTIRYPHDSGRSEDLEKFRRSAEQERAQLKVELSQKWQEERSKRLATESHVQILESQVQQLRRERVDLSDLSSRNRELEGTLDTTRRKLAEERQIKDNFEDLLTAMRVELEQLRNERDHLRDEVIPQISGGTYKPPSSSADPSEIERLMGEIEALKIENASLAQLQGTRFASIAEEDDGRPTRGRTSGLGISMSRSNSLARMHSKPSRPSSLSRSNSFSAKERDTRENLADHMNDVEAQRDALHQTLRNLLARQAIQAREYEKRSRMLEIELARAQEAGSPRRLGYERDVRNLREEVNYLRQRAEEALEQKWQCEKGLAGLKMDLDRAEQETASLRELLQEHDISLSQNSGATAEGRDGFAEVLATTSSLESAYEQLQADRDQVVAQSPAEATGELAESLNRTEALTTHVRKQLESNSSLRRRLAEAIGQGEKEQQVSAARINELQSQLKSLEDMLLTAQQLSEEEMAKHEEEIRQLQDSHNDQLQRMKNGSRSPAALSPRPPQSPFFGTRSPRLDKTTSGNGVPLIEVVQPETLAKRVRELERLLRNADLEMEEVVGRMNRAQIDVAELQSDRDEALRQTRKLQSEILAERELFKTLLSQ